MRFNLGAKLGKGAYASVYAFEHDLAFKRFNREDDDGLKSLIVELSILMTLKGKTGILDVSNISLINDIGFSMKRYPCTLQDKFPYTTYLKIKDKWHIRFHRQNSPKPISSMTDRILFQLLLALYHAHNVGIIHADVKPQNILIDDSGDIALIDWGIAAIPLINADELNIDLQTLGFRAPEIAYGDSSLCNPKIDIYSAALVYYYITNDSCNFFKYTTMDSEAEFYQRNPKLQLENKPDDTLEHLLSGMLTHSDTRFTAAECLKHKYFDKFTKCDIADIANISNIRSLRNIINADKDPKSFVPEIRAYIHKYLVETINGLECDRACIVMAMMIYDYMYSVPLVGSDGTTTKTHSDHKQLIIVVAILLASEFIDASPVSIRNLSSMLDSRWTIENVIRTRNIVFRKLDYNLYFMTPIIALNSMYNGNNKDAIVDEIIAAIGRCDYYDYTEGEIAIRAISALDPNYQY